MSTRPLIGSVKPERRELELLLGGCLGGLRSAREESGLESALVQALQSHLQHCQVLHLAGSGVFEVVGGGVADEGAVGLKDQAVDRVGEVLLDSFGPLANEVVFTLE
jgi:hypothetical protein